MATIPDLLRQLAERLNKDASDLPGYKEGLLKILETHSPIEPYAHEFDHTWVCHIGDVFVGWLGTSDGTLTLRLGATRGGVYKCTYPIRTGKLTYVLEDRWAFPALCAAYVQVNVHFDGPSPPTMVSAYLDSRSRHHMAPNGCYISRGDPTQPALTFANGFLSLADPKPAMLELPDMRETQETRTGSAR